MMVTLHVLAGLLTGLGNLFFRFRRWRNSAKLSWYEKARDTARTSFNELRLASEELDTRPDPKDEDELKELNDERADTTANRGKASAQVSYLNNKVKSVGTALERNKKYVQATNGALTWIVPAKRPILGMIVGLVWGITLTTTVTQNGVLEPSEVEAWVQRLFDAVSAVQYTADQI